MAARINRQLLFALSVCLALLTAATLIVAWPRSAWALDGSDPMGFRTTAKSLGPWDRFWNEHIASDGSVAYCIDHNHPTPTNPGAETFTTYDAGWSWLSDALNIVAYHGYPNTTTIGGQTWSADEARAATQLALWMVIGDVDDNGLATNGVDYGAAGGKRTAIIQAAARLKNDAVSGKLTAPRYARRYEAVRRNGTLVQAMLWAPLDVTVRFSKTSADAAITTDNAEYALEGAVYDIFQADTNAKVTTITTDASGHASCQLKPGTSYYAVETKAPRGFIRNTERVSFTAASDTAVDLEDAPGTFRIIIGKKDACTRGAAQAGATLAGATFKLTSTSVPGFERTATTDASGSCTFSAIPLGTVRIVETKAPAGYLLDPEPKTYTVHADDLTEQGILDLVPENDFRERIIACDLELTKVLDSGKAGSKLEQAAPGVSFDIISGTTGKAVGRITTNEQGVASTVGSWFGTGNRVEGISGALPFDAKGYTVREVAETVPAGYARIDDWHIDADELRNGAKLSYIVSNDALTARLQIVKLDAATKQTVPLAGFSFEIHDAAGHTVEQETWYPSHEKLTRFTTDETGTVTLPEPLPTGTYTVHEVTSVAPYLRTTTGTSFTITGTVKGQAPIAVVTVADRPARGRATLTKTCADNGKPLEGARYNVVAEADVVSPDGSVQAAKGAVVDTVTTGKDGTATTKELPLGAGTARYAFIETKAPAGHVLKADPIPFTLSWRDQTTAVVSARAAARNVPTRVELEKRELASDNPLKGAIFALWNVADEDKDAAVEEPQAVPPALKKGKKAQTFTTDEKGRITIEHLEAGTYRIVETKAPAGYVRDHTPRTFTVAADGRIDGKEAGELSVENDHTRIDISKRAVTSEEEIPGARLTVMDKDGTVVDRWTSGTEPHRIERLAPGTYTLREEMTPQTYDQAQEVSFTVEETGEVQPVVMYDQPIRITGELDKRQEIARPTAADTEPDGDGRNRAEAQDAPGPYAYTLDFRSTSSTWTDEYTVEDVLMGADAGLAQLVSLTTPKATGDFDGRMNIWYRTNKTPATYEDDSHANATLSDGHENPWLEDERCREALGDDGRRLSYEGWRLWRADVPTDEAQTLAVSDLNLGADETVVGIRLEYGRVEAGFTTRSDGWDRDDLKDVHDDLSLAPTAHDKTHAPALLRCRVTDAYRAGMELSNGATVDLYRNGGGTDLEDHDDDGVVQVPRDKAQPLPQTGLVQGISALVLVAAGSAALWLRLRHGAR